MSANIYRASIEDNLVWATPIITATDGEERNGDTLETVGVDLIQDVDDGGESVDEAETVYAVEAEIEEGDVTEEVEIEDIIEESLEGVIVEGVREEAVVKEVIVEEAGEDQTVRNEAE